MRKTKLPEAPVVRFVPATTRDPAQLYVRCPYGCVARTPTGRLKRNGETALHLHGGGGLGMDHTSMLGGRGSHCVDGRGRGREYELTDPHGVLVPVPAVVTS